MNVRQAREPETMGFSSPHALTDTRACRPIMAALGVHRDPLTRRCHVPGEATIRRVPARVDGDAVDATIGAWLADRLRPLRQRRGIAVDGKTLRGSVCSGHQVHLLAALDHHDGAVLAQRECPPPATRSPRSSRCLRAWTLPVRWSPPTRCTPKRD